MAQYSFHSGDMVVMGGKWWWYGGGEVLIDTQ